MDNKEFYFIAPLPAFRKRTRLAKMVPIFLERGYSVILLGWEREKQELKKLKWSDSRVKEVAILKGGGYVSRKARLMYPVWIINVFFRVLFLGRRKNLFCLGWETAFPALMASFFTGSKVIFDDADRFSMILGLPNAANRILEYLEQWASREAFVHLIPGWTRYEWRNSKMAVLRNSPNLSDFDEARAASLAKDDAVFNVYINGWVGHTRGAPVFLKALNLICEVDDRIVFHIAGRVDSLEGRLLASHPRSVFYGEVSQAKALEIYAISDVVLTYYDPSVAINRHAESNKWGDCVFFGTPFVVNSEVATAEKFVAAGAAWALRYSDAAALASLLLSLSEDREAVKSASISISQYLEEYPTFDTQVNRIIDRVETR